MNTKICERLSWDSEFFGINVARAAINRLDADTIQKVSSWCQRESIDCLYFLAASEHPQTIRIAEEHGFRLVAVRLTLELILSGWEPQKPTKADPHILIRTVRAEDLRALQNIAKDIFTNSRFYADGRFPKDKCQMLYQAWVKNICEGHTDMGLVATIEGQIQGFISGHKSATTGRIDLVGVRREAQGSGIGNELVHSGTEWYADRGVEHVKVVTQGRNIIAQRLYQRHGYLAHSCQLHYHKWYSDGQI